MAESSAARRRLLRHAEAALADPGAAAELKAEGIELGEAVSLTPEELEADLEAEEELNRVTVGITVFFSDTPVGDRGQIEDPLADYLELHDIGEWLGSGQGSIGDQAFFDMSFAVNSLEVALPIIQRKLKELGAGPSTEFHASDGRMFKLGGAA